MSTPFVYRLGDTLSVDLVAEDVGAENLADLTLKMWLTNDLHRAEMDVLYTAAIGDAPAFWRGSLAPLYRTGAYRIEALLTRADGSLCAVPTAKLVNILEKAVV